MIKVLKEAEVHKQEFEAFDKMLRAEDAASVDEWEKACDAFHSDSSKPCPYMVDTDGKH